jgi:hypothetical protein
MSAWMLTIKKPVQINKIYMIKYLKYICIIFFIFIQLGLAAQENCIKSFQRARRLYDQGMIDEIPEILAPCIEAGFTRNQKIEAYKLIILAYLFDDDQYEAEKAMLEFLKKYPEYEIMPSDPVEFVYLFESYKTKAIISLGFTFGPNLTNPRIIERYVAGDITRCSSANSTGAGFQAGFNVSRYITNRVFVNLGAIYKTSQYSFMDNMKVIYKGDEERLAKITFDETVSRLDIPFSIAYEIIKTRNINYYLSGGFSAGNISKATGIPSISTSEDLPAVTGADIIMTDFRETILYSGIIGTGIKYKVPRGFLIFDLQYSIGINNIVIPETRNEISDLWSAYYYIDDDYSVNSLTIAVGYYFSFYQPKKQN